MSEFFDFILPRNQRRRPPHPTGQHRHRITNNQQHVCRRHGRHRHSVHMKAAYSPARPLRHPADPTTPLHRLPTHSRRFGRTPPLRTHSWLQGSRGAPAGLRRFNRRTLPCHPHPRTSHPMPGTAARGSRGGLRGRGTPPRRCRTAPAPDTPHSPQTPPPPSSAPACMLAASRHCHGLPWPQSSCLGSARLGSAQECELQGERRKNGLATERHCTVTQS